MADYRRNNKSSSSRSFGRVIDINRIDDHHHSIKQTNLNLKQSIVINNKNNDENHGHDDDHEDSNNKMFKTTTLKNDEQTSNQNHDKENGQNAKIKKSTTAVNEKRKSSTSNTTVVIHDDNSDDHHNNVDDNKSNDDDDDDEFHKSKMLKWMTVSNLEFENNDQDRYHYHMIELRTTFETLIQMDEKNKRLQTKIENIRKENEQLELMKDEIDQIYASFITTE